MLPGSVLCQFARYENELAHYRFCSLHMLRCNAELLDDDGWLELELLPTYCASRITMFLSVRVRAIARVELL